MIPIGTEIRVATPVITSVPTIACWAPPPAPITPRADSVKKEPSKRAVPFLITSKSTEKSGATATKNAATIPRVTSRSIACRRFSTIRDQM